jgi:hypothetical protein
MFQYNSMNSCPGRLGNPYNVTKGRVTPNNVCGDGWHSAFEFAEMQFDS